MKYNNIVKLAQTTESSGLEFKESTGQLERGMETMCAFLNAQGGTILFGVNDNGVIKGQEVSDKTKRDIAEAVRRIEPMARIDIFYVPIPNTGKFVIVLEIEDHYYSRPFTYKGRAYQRLESITAVMPQEMYNQLLMQRGGAYCWETMGNDRLNIKDIDENAVMGAVRAGIRSGRLPETTIREEIPAILEKFNLLHDGKINNAAAVLFGQKLYEYPQCLLRLARFKGRNKEEFLDNQRVQGNIYELLDAAMAFFFKHINLSGKIEGLYREEELNIPYKALRECCINAFCHRTYSHPGSSVGIAIYDDRVEIENTGCFPAEMTLEKLLKEHHSKPQNPLIANVLYKSEILESWGRGIGLMIDECRRVGLPDPEFRSDGSFVWVVFRYKHEIADKYPTSTRQVPDKLPTSSRQVETLVTLIGNDMYSLKEIMELMQLKDRENFLNNYLYPAMEAGLVEPLYVENPKHPRQKYLLTEKGKEIMSKDHKN